MRTAHYLRYKQGGRWHSAMVETRRALIALKEYFNDEQIPHEYHGRWVIPEDDGEFIIERVEME